MAKKTKVCLAALLMLFSTGHVSAQPAAAPPAPRWVLETGGPTCTISRELPGNPSATLVVQTYAGSKKYDVVLSTRAWPAEIRKAGKLQLSLQPSGAQFERPAFVALLPRRGAPTDIRFLSLNEGFFQAFAGAKSLIILAGRRTIAKFDLPAAAAVAGKWAECERTKLAEWGADPMGLVPGAVGPKPIGDSPRWVSPTPLMKHFKVRNQISAVSLLRVDKSGRVESCSVLESNLKPEGDAALCRILKEKARYEPARDPNGNAVVSVATHEVSAAISISVEPS